MAAQRWNSVWGEEATALVVVISPRVISKQVLRGAINAQRDWMDGKTRAKDS